MHSVRAFAFALASVGASCTRPAASPAKAPLPICPEHTFAIAGACLSNDEAHLYCGKAARPEAGGCVPTACSDIEPMDLSSGECVTMLDLRDVATRHHIDLKEDTSLGCKRVETTLAVEGDHVACLPRATRCGRGGTWADGACHADTACPRGAVPDTDGACIAVVHEDHGSEMLDVGAWIRLVVGPDGGKGAAAICGPLIERPWLLGIVPHGNTVVDVEARLVFPDNDVHEARVTVIARKHFDARQNGDPLSPLGIGKYFEPVWVTLRSLGGVANAASAVVNVHCAVDGGTDAVSVPRSGSGEDVPQATDGGKPGS